VIETRKIDLVLCQPCSDTFRADLLPRGMVRWEAAVAKRYRVTLTAEEREALGGMISRGKADARKLAHARVLLQADAAEGRPGWPDTRIAEAVRVSVRTIERVRQRFVEDGLEAALLPRPSPRVYTRKLDGAQEAKLLAVACSEPPEGKKRWTLRLLAERMVELEVVPELSHETVRQTLKKECAQTASAADVVHPAQALGRVRVPHGRCAGGLPPPA
jgi:transposase